MATKLIGMRQAGSFAIVIILHIALIYALVVGSGHYIIKKINISPQPVMTRIVEKPKDREYLPPSSPPRKSKPAIPSPEIPITQQSANAITQTTSTGSDSKPSIFEGNGEANHVPPQIISIDACRPTYPSISRRLGETGMIQVLVLVDIDGKAIDSKIGKSSGHPRLDDAALFSITNCAFKPGKTSDGRAERVWHMFPYEFRLE